MQTVIDERGATTQYVAYLVELVSWNPRCIHMKKAGHIDTAVGAQHVAVLL